LLGDFGITMAVHRAHTLGQQEISGTVSYMSPEQIQGNSCMASDQYALGVVVYEWLCGELPFQGSSLMIAHQHLSDDPPSMRAKIPTIPLAVEDVVLRALVKDPQQRFGSVQEFAIALERAYKCAPTLHHLILYPRPSHGARQELEKPVMPPSSQAKESKKLTSSQEIAKIFAADLFIGTTISIILSALDIETQILLFLIWLCIIALPFLGAFTMRNRKAFILASSILSASAVLGIGLHSQILFAVVYVGLSLLSMLIAFSMSLHGF